MIVLITHTTRGVVVYFSTSNPVSIKDCNGVLFKTDNADRLFSFCAGMQSVLEDLKFRFDGLYHFGTMFCKGEDVGIRFSGISCLEYSMDNGIILIKNHDELVGVVDPKLHLLPTTSSAMYVLFVYGIQSKHEDVSHKFLGPIPDNLICDYDLGVSWGKELKECIAQEAM